MDVLMKKHYDRRDLLEVLMGRDEEDLGYNSIVFARSWGMNGFSGGRSQSGGYSEDGVR
jgi:hypothetical protein